MSRIQLSGNGLSARALQMMRSNSPTGADIVNNQGLFDELSEEIQNTYTPSEEDLAKAKADGYVEPTKAPPVKKEVLMREYDPEAELAREEAELDKQLEAQRLQKEEEAEKARKEAAENPEAAASAAAQDMRSRILALLRGHANAPSQAQIDAWKAKYKDVQVLALGEGDVYVFTYLRRGQHQKILSVVAKAAQSEQFNQKPEDMQKEKILQYTVLWPRPLTVEFLHNSRAGVIDTLTNVILANSYFVPIENALGLTTKL